MQQPTPDTGRLQQFIQNARTHDLSTKARERLTWLEHFAGNGCSVSVTCRHFGIQRMTLYRVLRRCDFLNPVSLEDGVRRMLVPRAVAPVGQGQVQPAHVHGPASDAECVFCHVKAFDWRKVKRALILGSVLANIALIGMFAATMFAESGRAPESLRATLLGPEKQQIYTLVPLP